MDLFSNDLPIRVSDYQHYFHHLVIIDPSIQQQLAAIPIDRISPIRALKVVIFIHCWLQATCLLEDTEPVLHFINQLLGHIRQQVEQTKKRRGLSQKKMSRSSV
jgi:hypothetical protein